MELVVSSALIAVVLLFGFILLVFTLMWLGEKLFDDPSAGLALGVVFLFTWALVYGIRAANAKPQPQPAQVEAVK